MEEELPTEYEVIVYGTGLVECIVAAAAARVGKKVLHIDKNDHYGVQWASFTLKGIQQWVDEVTATPVQPSSGECDLEDGEELVVVGNPSQDYSGVKQTWHVPEKAAEIPSQETLSNGPVGDVVEEAIGATPEDTQQISTADTPPTTPPQPTPPQLHPQPTPEDTKQASTTDTPPTTPTQPTPEDIQQANTSDTSRPTTTQPPQPADDTSADTVHATTQETTPPPQQSNSCEKSENEDCTMKKEWSKEELMNVSRKFNLDLTPKLLYSRGPMVELLISSNIARYAEFKCISQVLTWRGGDDGTLLLVPCSRSDIFKTSAVTLVEKRLLMKFLEFCHQYDRHPEQLQEHLDKPFVNFLRSRKLTDNLIHFVTEAIGMVGEGAGCREGLERTRAFLTSLGRYGTTPFLFSMYGSGELPQAFCRLCAVFEGTYILRKPVSSLVVHSPSNTCRGLVSEGQRFTCTHLVVNAAHSPSQYLPQDWTAKKLSRAIFLTDRSILPNEKEQLTLLRIPAKDGNSRPINVLEVGPGTYVCAKDLYCVHMTCQGHDAQGDLRVAIQRLLTSDADDSNNKPRIIWSLYFNQVDYSACDLEACTPSNVYLCPGPNIDLDYDLAIKQAQSIFERMFPGEEFLPRAPDPEEIAFDNQGAEPKQGDTFEDEENSTTEEGKIEDGNGGGDAEEKEVKAGEE